MPWYTFVVGTLTTPRVGMPCVTIELPVSPQPSLERAKDAAHAALDRIALSRGRLPPDWLLVLVCAGDAQAPATGTLERWGGYLP